MLDPAIIVGALSAELGCALIKADVQQQERFLDVAPSCVFNVVGQKHKGQESIREVGKIDSVTAFGQSSPKWIPMNMVRACGNTNSDTSQASGPTPIDCSHGSLDGSFIDGCDEP